MRQLPQPTLSSGAPAAPPRTKSLREEEEEEKEGEEEGRVAIRGLLAASPHFCSQRTARGVCASACICCLRTTAAAASAPSCRRPGVSGELWLFTAW